MLPALQALGCRLGLGVDEDAAVLVRGSVLEVIGGSGAVLVDMGEATRDPALPAFNLQGARLSYLGAGDCHDLASGVTTPAARKRCQPHIAPQAAHFSPRLGSGRYFLDILGDGCLREALVQLLDGPAARVGGLAFRADARPDEPQADIGFEFWLHRGPGLVGWRDAGAGGDDYTVLNARLDVMPVRVASPLFQPLAAVPARVVESVGPSSPP
jgi:cyanophycinase